MTTTYPDAVSLLPTSLCRHVTERQAGMAGDEVGSQGQERAECTTAHEPESQAAQEPLPYSTSLWHMFSNIMANTTNAAAPMNSDEAFAPVRLCHIMPAL